MKSCRLLPGLVARVCLLLCTFALAAAFAADRSDLVLQRIAFGSCAHQDRPQPIWAQVSLARPDLFILLGDNVYGDTEDMDLLRAKYAKFDQVPGFRRLRESTPLLATWDDHDYGENDAGANYLRRAESQQVFLDFMRVPADSPRRRRAGIYHAQLFGPPDRRVQVILLDTRYHRSPLVKRVDPARLARGPYVANEDPQSTVLGAEQWDWLEAQLRIPARLRFIASSIQVVPEDHGWEKWMNFPHERERLFRMIRETGAAGVVFLSGDRHLAELSMMDGGVGYPLYDITSSGINQASPRWRRYEENRHRVGTMNWGNHFGMVDIDWGREDPRLSFQIRDADGDIAIQRKVFLSTLQPGVIE
jgi:alkaline phosphatase D